MKKQDKILITGGNGLLGSYIIRHLLQDGYEDITAIIRPDGKKDLLEEIDSNESRLHWKTGDILDISFLEEEVSGMDYVIHCAAIVHFDNRHKKHLNEVNVTGTANVVNICLDSKVKKLLYISSTAALGRTYNNQMIDEKTTWERSEFNTPYAISKHLGEIEVWRGHEEGLDVCILNPSLIITPGYFDRSSASLYSHIFKKMNHYPTGINGVVDVRDVAQLAILLLQYQSSNLRLIACADNIAYRDLFSRIAMGFDKPIPTIAILKKHRMFINIFAKIKTLFGGKSNLSKTALINSSMNFYYDNSKSIQLFDYKYRNIKESIIESCQAYKEGTDKGQNYCTLRL